MKSSFEIAKQVNSSKYSDVIYYDQIEIDNPDSHDFIGLRYKNRINSIISKVKAKYPNPENAMIGDFACAQSNVSLTLAEMGYKVFAFDIDESFIEYSKLKYEFGDIEWINSNIDEMEFPENELDFAIAGELVEHCAYPEEILSKIFRFIKPGGYLLITTPNGLRLKQPLPTFKQYFEKESRKKFEEIQFGPEGKDHLFLFTIDELDYIVPKNGKLVEKGYLGGTVLMNKFNQFFWRLFPVDILENMMINLATTPIINTKTYNNLYAIIQKNPE